jgi:hypothetical protein
MGVPRTATGGRIESGYFQATVETARIINVNVNDYTVDAVGEFGNKRFFDVQVMSPYFHYFNGEGWYAMPEVGALCWVCQESAGLYAKHFILGYQSPYDERTLEGSELQAGGFRANRQSLNPGDMMWRGRDENFVVLRRGGVVQIGASPANQRIYIPIGSLIRDFCFGYELQTLSGDLMFVNDREDQDDAGQVKTRFRLRTKTLANEKDHAVILIAGSHEDDAALRLSLQVNESGAEGAPLVAQLQIDKEGTVTWTMEKDLLMTATGKASLSAGGDIDIQSTEGNVSLSSKLATSLSSGASLGIEAKGAATLSGATATVEGASIALKGKTQIGGPGGEPLVKGAQLITFLTNLIVGLTDPTKPFGVSTPPGTPALFPGMAALLPSLSSIISTNNTTT